MAANEALPAFAPKLIETTRRRGLVATASSFEPLIREYEDAIENERVLPAELVDALYEAGVFATFLPRELGGLEANPIEWMEMVEEFARINGSVGWNAFINTGGTSLPPDEMRQILTKERWITAGVVGRMAGKAVKVAGGYRVSGRWPFASGAPFATYHTGVSLLYDENDAPVLNPATNTPATISATWPASQSTLHDTWDGLGLRGTGSVDIEVIDLFVPDAHAAGFFSGGRARRPYAGAIYKSIFIVLLGHAAHALGIARCAIDSFVDLVQRTQAAPAHGSYRQRRLGQQQAHHIGVAKAEALVRAGRLLAWDAAQRAWDYYRANDAPNREIDVLMQQAIIFATRASKEAVGFVFDAAGTSAVFRGRELERCYRDIATACQHTVVVETSYETVGQYYLSKGQEGAPPPSAGP
jgi:alkylation response protein AidB-like acyl-CoA dehydrogenase